MTHPMIRHALCGFAALAIVLLTISATGWAQSSDEGLSSAYKKEFAYLEAQKEALQGRLDKLEKREASQVSSAQNELDALQGRLLGLQTEADRLQETLAQVERDAEQAGASGEMIATTVEQANATFDKWGEAVHAVIVPRPENTEVQPEELIAFCREHIGGYKVPKGIDIQHEPLPKSGPGKVLKRDLRAPYWEGTDRAVN